VTISFGMLDIVNIAHPAFIMLGSLLAYFVNSNFGVDPILIGVVMIPAFFLIGMGVYQIYYYAFERRGEESIQGLAFFFGLLFIGEVALILVFGVDYRFVVAPYLGPSLHLGFVDLPLRMLIPFLVSLLMLAVLQVFLGRTFIGRAILAVSQDRLALQLMAANPSRVKRIALGVSIATAAVAGALLIIIQPVEPSIGRDYIGRIFAICVLGGMTSFPGMLAGALADRHRRKHHLDVLRSVLGARRRLRLSAVDPRRASGRPPRPVVNEQSLLPQPLSRNAGEGLLPMKRVVGTTKFFLVSFAVGLVLLVLSRWLITNEYYFFAAYQVLQFVVLATAWNILGGYTATPISAPACFCRRGLQRGRAAQTDLGAGPGDGCRKPANTGFL
jgi:branched-chain amino acid transport system permease protein